MKPITGRWTTLRIADRGDYDGLYRLALASEGAWMWRGRTRGPESFVDSLWSGVLANIVVVQTESSRVVGLLQAYSHNPTHQVCHMNVFLDEDAQGSGWPLEALGMFLKYLFQHYNLRKVYAEMTEPSLKRLGSRFDGWAEVEGRLKDHIFDDGEFVDIHIIAIHRERFLRRAA